MQRKRNEAVVNNNCSPLKGLIQHGPKCILMIQGLDFCYVIPPFPSLQGHALGFKALHLIGRICIVQCAWALDLLLCQLS